MLAGGIQVLPVVGMGEIEPGTDLAAVLGAGLEEQGTPLQDGGILVVTQHIVSAADGCVVWLEDVEPSPLAVEWAARWTKDPRVVELVLRESRRIVRMERGAISRETRNRMIGAKA